MLDIALEIPLRALALAWGRQSDDAALTRVEHLREHLDRSALAGRVTALENDDDALLRLRDPARQRAELLGERLQELFIVLVAEFARPAHRRPLAAEFWHARPPIGTPARAQESGDHAIV